MSSLLIELSIAFGAINVVVSVLVVANRFLIRRAEARYASAVTRLKPVVLGWIGGIENAPRARTAKEREVLVDLLSKYGRSLTGDGRARVIDLAADAGLIEDLLRRSRSRRAWKRAAAAFKLGDIGSAQTWRLITLMSDRDRQVRNAAARSLGKQGSMESVAPIVLALSTGQVARPVGGQALIDIGSAAAPGLSALMASDSPEVRAVAAELLGRIGTAEHGRLLSTHLTDEDPTVRVAVVRALGRLGGRAAAAAIPELLDDDVAFVRAAAATAVGKSGRRSHLDRLIRIAMDDSYLPAHAAATAAAELDTEAVRQAAIDTENPHLIEAIDMIWEPV